MFAEVCQLSDTDRAAPDPSTRVVCPYCGRPLRWTPMRWLTRGLFECERCGEFPDFSRHPPGAFDSLVADPRH